MSITKLASQIFNVHKESFESLALEIFKEQARNNTIYRKYLDALYCHPEQITCLLDIPFLPIQFFKTHKVINGNEKEVELCFESSGTTTQLSSKHYIHDIEIYEQSFIKTFKDNFGEPSQYCILGLLPSYLERGNSSLVYMVNHLIAQSKNDLSGFYLNNHEALFQTLCTLESNKQRTIIFGVTYALLDFADKYQIPLIFTEIIETGGMKGRHVELIRNEVHNKLKEAFSLKGIHTEYGMSELLSQAYSTKDGILLSPSWMRVLVRDMNDPFQYYDKGKGILNIIDLANIHSCSFIATDDVGEVFEDGTFVVNGRLDHAELRGCSMLAQ